MTLAVQQPHRFRLLGCNTCQLHEQVHVNKSLLCNALCISRWDPQRLQVESAPHRVDSMGSLCLVSMQLNWGLKGVWLWRKNSPTQHETPKQKPTPNYVNKTSYMHFNSVRHGQLPSRVRWIWVPPSIHKMIDPLDQTGGKISFCPRSSWKIVPNPK